MLRERAAPGAVIWQSLGNAHKPPLLTRNCPFRDEFRRSIELAYLYSGDETGCPGTALTSFARGDLPADRNGNGMAFAIAFVIPIHISRCYFGSVYFREPGGVPFEIATDDPGHPR